MTVDYAELVTRTRRACGLSGRITDDALIERLAAMVRSTPTRSPARRPADADPSRETDRDRQGAA